MSIDVSLKQATLDALKQKLEAARAGLKTDGVVMKQIAVYLDQWVQRNFRGKGENVSGWEPYKYGGRVVAKDKATSKAGNVWINGSAVMLQDTGALRISFLPFIRKGVAGIGSELPYSKTHEDGDPERNIPQRRLLPVNAEVDVRILEILDNFVKVTIRKAQS